MIAPRQKLRPELPAERRERLDPDELLELHRKILSGDLTARETLADKVLLPMLHTMGRRHPEETSGTVLLHAVENALISYLNRPEQYKPERGSNLLTYLVMAAGGDRLNELDRRHRRRKREVQLAPVGNIFDVEEAATAAALRTLHERRGGRVRPKPRR